MAEMISDVGEFGLIRWVGALLRKDGAPSARVSVGIGDDAASFLPRPGFELLVTCDSMVEGRHYLPASFRAIDIGRRAMASNISDVGAMGGTPLFALASLGLKPDMPVHEVEELYRGFLSELNPFGASVIGGNFTATSGATFVDITLIGEVEQGSAVRRNGARPGDAVLTTGYPGRSAAGLALLRNRPRDEAVSDHPLVRAYLTPAHRARVGIAVARTRRVTAMIDTSDGFLQDLGHICEESGTGAELFEERIPVDEAIRKTAAVLGQDPYAFVLGPSDDYELVMTCAPADVALLKSAAAEGPDTAVTEVGRITAGPGITLVREDGTRRTADIARWDHFGR